MEIVAAQALWPAVFLVAGGAGKLAETRAGPSEGTLLGRVKPERLPYRLVLAGAAVLELVLGFLLITSALAPWSRIAAAGLLGIVAVVAFDAVRHGSRADCGCMGSLGSARVSPLTVARALMLALRRPSARRRASRYMML
jgi:Methylamine utilisation protein MauE